ncbi:putative glycosyl transferase, family 28 [Nostoc commune NIES-4072]|uniref:Putative glycosyl transferase, family 28 n=1 Tax=Nostoc commune NIES-4072 TaxID=2005467 RepID=A0A2R5FWS9_NOSCO|nr:hypothetical protein [Nostoc commune]BBD70514.1 putative glycosyl transferase, family 28 [Nostoc commune HK-02]GBG23170.1 putative glycosyl transferase, family 28 [Nostoc commune NIES-4072]
MRTKPRSHFFALLPTLKRLGTSRMILRKEYSAVRVAKKLRQLLGNPNYAVKAAKIASIIQAENGVKVACDAIEKQLAAA